MKHIAQDAQLHIYHATTQKAQTHSRFFSQKHMDMAVILASFAGLLSAVTFLITMP